MGAESNTAMATSSQTNKVTPQFIIFEERASAIILLIHVPQNPDKEQQRVLSVQFGWIVDILQRGEVLYRICS